MRRFSPACYAQTPRGVDPSVLALHRAIVSERMGITDISVRAGVKRNTIGSWLRGVCSPSVANIRACLNVMGLDLKVVPMRNTNDSEKE